MGRWLKRIGIACGALVALLGIAATVVYVGSERILHRQHPVPASHVPIPTDAASIAEGRRLALVRGCMAGCHGPNGEGGPFLDLPLIVRLDAPSLSAAARRYSAQELVTIIRHGVRPDGASVFVMPSSTFSTLTDGDVGRIVAFLKSRPSRNGPGPRLELGPIGRLGLFAGKFKTEADMIAAGAEPPPARSPAGARGRYLARTVCTECHGADLTGDSNPDFTSPDLRVVAAYPADDFKRLMRTGTALGNRELKLMKYRAVHGLSHMTDEEIEALYGYLHSLAGS